MGSKEDLDGEAHRQSHVSMTRAAAWGADGRRHLPNMAPHLPNMDTGFACDLPDAVRPYVHLLPNPSSFVLGGVTVAASSLDVLMLLGQQELAKQV